MQNAPDTDPSFKKTETASGHSGVTKNNINDDYFKDPPNNIDHSIKQQGNPLLKEGYPKDTVTSEDLGLGRVTKEAELAEITQDNSVHR